MADDARICTALAHHPKTVKVQRRLGDKGCWRLVALFLWVAENRPDGDLVGMNSEDIEIAGGWDGEPGKFTQTLVEVRFLDGEKAPTAFTIGKNTIPGQQVDRNASPKPRQQLPRGGTSEINTIDRQHHLMLTRESI